MAKQKIPLRDLVESHKPKNFKFKYIFKDDTALEELIAEGYDISSLDTISDEYDDELVRMAINTEVVELPRESVAKAKQPTVVDNGVVLSKKMITKTDKKLFSVGVGAFDYKDSSYTVVRFKYERFDIIEIFIMI